jgi:hypothetical protein
MYTKNIKGSHTLEELVFSDKEHDINNKFLKPDLVIMESHKIISQVDYRDILHLDSLDKHPRMHEETAMVVDSTFAVHYGLSNPEIFAVGQGAACKSFIEKGFYRSNDVKYNIENGFYAAMNMLNKSINFNQLPMTRLTIGETEIYYVGERGVRYDDVHMTQEGDKKVYFFIKSGEVVGFMTVGF